MKPLSQGSNGWFHTLPERPSAPSVSDEERADWLVVGAGCCGLAAAHRLGELCPDDRVALLEADRVGFGSSGRNSGFMLDAHVHGLKTDAQQLRGRFRLWSAGLEWLRTMVRDHQIRCDWSEWGRLYAAVDAEGLHHLRILDERFRALGLAVRTLDRDQMREATGSAFYREGVHLNGSALVQPAALMRGLAEVLPENVRLFENTSVRALERERGAWRAITDAGSVTAVKLIVTAGVHAPELGFLRHQLVPLSLYASLTRPLDDAERTVFAAIDELGILPSSAHGSTVRLTRDGRILMRNTTRYARYAGNERDDLHDVQAVHRDAIARRWPALADVAIEHTWGGVMAVTRNGGALFTEVGDGAYAVGTSDVSPVTRGVIAGRLMADLATGRASELLEMQLALERATRVPPDPLLRWVANRRLAKLARAEAAEL